MKAAPTSGRKVTSESSGQSPIGSARRSTKRYHVTSAATPISIAKA
jgi:hypothetical protein